MTDPATDIQQIVNATLAHRSDCTMLPPGKPCRNSDISLFTLRDGQLAANAEFFDPLVFLQAQGATLSVLTGSSS